MSAARGARRSRRPRAGDDPEAPPEFLRRLGLSPRKALGQHFLVDELLLSRIADACLLGPDDTVIEIGAGPGGLSIELAERAGTLVAVEIDEELASLARRQLEGRARACVVAADALGVAPGELLEECGASAPYVMAGNLPYYITQPLIRRFLEADESPERIVVLVQREVARRIVGGPGKESLLSLSVKTYGRPEALFDVPSSAFWPAPKVQSALVRIERLPRPAVDLPPPALARFFLLLRAGFAEPRKQLHNGLRSALGLSRDEAQALLRDAAIDPALRAQHLDLDDWRRLHALTEQRWPRSLDVG
ncbi:MAG: ribosomal RNA small subunit methyltransferase A [Chloroflexi bacterium]|nr:ribosomal RNA small subunit methyltransferase A [Chloroflexota bacterium]